MRRTKTLAGALLVLVASVTLGLAMAEQTDKPAEARAPDREAIHAVLTQFKEAFQKGDAAAAAGLMTAEAELIPDNAELLKGRDAIQKAFAAQFAEGGRPNFKLDAKSMRFPSRDVALEDGIMTVTHVRGEPEVHHYHILYAREDGKWLISVIKEWPAEASPLAALQELIGTWSGKNGDAELETTYEWFGNKRFIKATVNVHQKGLSFKAVQMIGSDPTTGEIRTWTFEHDGGFGEGTCLRDGSRWTFENAAQLVNGDILTATNLLVFVDADTLTWQPLNLEVNGEQFGNLPPVKMTRVKK